MTVVEFRHTDPGTAEDVWAADAAARSIDDVAGIGADIDELVVVAAHPDDETLGAAGLIARVHSVGGRVTVLIATDGEASHPDSTTHTPAELAALRREEATAAVQSLAPGAEVRFLGLPDGGLREHQDELRAALREALDPPYSAPTSVRIVVAPWSGDGHRDHRVAAEAVAGVCSERGVPHLGYPIWLWHWGTPADVPWQRARRVVLTTRERDLKRAALELHPSQLLPLSDLPGDEAIVHDGMRAHFDRDVELYFAEHSTPDAERRSQGQADTLASQFFDEFYARHDDPWGFETRWYERRKRAILLASLPDERLGAVLEIGCSTGLITQGLVVRADSVIAVDAARAALDAARARIGDDVRVSFVRGGVPATWPAGSFDTIVLSEVGYYLSPADLGLTVGLIVASLRTGGSLVACHWRHPVREYPQSGDDVHRVLRAVDGWERLVCHEEADFVLEVFTAHPARSVAAREGFV